MTTREQYEAAAFNVAMRRIIASADDEAAIRAYVEQLEAMVDVLLELGFPGFVSAEAKREWATAKAAKRIAREAEEKGAGDE